MVTPAKKCHRETSRDVESWEMGIINWTEAFEEGQVLSHSAERSHFKENHLMRINAMTSTVGFALLCTSTVAKAEWDEHWVTPNLGWSIAAIACGLPAQSANKPRA